MQTIRESSTQAVPMSLKTLRKKNLYLENICLCLVIDRQRRIADDTAHGYQDGSSGTGRTTTRLTCNPGKQCSQGRDQARGGIEQTGKCKQTGMRSSQRDVRASCQSLGITDASIKARGVPCDW